MKQSIEHIVKSLIRKAEREGKKSQIKVSRSRSSLHQIIKTREQGDRLMELLKIAEQQ